MPEQQALGTLYLNRNMEPTVKVYCSGIVYKYCCSSCGELYIGSTNVRQKKGICNVMMEMPADTPDLKMPLLVFCDLNIPPPYLTLKPCNFDGSSRGDVGRRQKHILLISQTFSCQEFNEFMSS